MSGAGRAAILIPRIGVGTALRWRNSRAFEIQQHCTSRASQCKSTLHILFFCFSKNMLTCQIKSPSLGSENLVPVTMVQLHHKLNWLLWTGTGILILISTSCGKSHFKFQRTFGQCLLTGKIHLLLLSSTVMTLCSFST